jgi:tRNA (mo5U34)-methyltransferase
MHQNRKFDPEELISLRARASELASSTYWLHSIQLFPDLLIEGGKSLEMLEMETDTILGPINLGGRSVLDIGAWNGHFSFEAKRRGAREVIASDSFVWSHPTFRGREAFELARTCLGLDIKAVEIDPTELPGPLEPADVVLFLGVFYHLYDPIAVLENVARTTKDVLIIETHQDLLELNRPAMVFYPRDTLNGDSTNWWGPNPECMLELLDTRGFAEILYQKHPAIPGRGIYHAFRRPEDLALYLTRPIDNRLLFNLRSPEGRDAVFGKSQVPVDPALDNEHAALAKERDRLAADHAALVAKLNKLKSAKSWRLTAPFRKLDRILR